MLRIILLVNLLNLLVESFPTGAPIKHCGDMLPGHHVEPFTDKAPFNLIVNPIDETNLNVRIQSDYGVHFKGFLLEARSDLNAQEALGEWSTQEPHTKLLDCFNESNTAVTHYFRDDDMSLLQDGPHFTQLNFNWNYEQMENLKQIYFVATIVKKFKQIYLNVTVQVVNPSQFFFQSPQTSEYFLLEKLKQFFFRNFKLEYVHFSFLFLFLFFFLSFFILLHVLSNRRNRENRYVLLKDENKLSNS